MTNATATSTIGSIQLVQAVSGCVQLRASDVGATVWLNTLGQQLRKQKGVLAVSTDATTGHLIIVFDPSGLPLSQMLIILQQWGVSGTSALQTPAVQVGQFLQQHHEVEALAPMIAGMLLTQTLRLRGGWALLANLVAASVTRSAIEQLEKHSGTIATSESQPAIAPVAPSTPEPEETPHAVAIVHAIPGRVRLRIPAIANDRTCAESVQKVLSADRRITSARINTVAASAIVVYESDGVSDREIILDLVAAIEWAIAANLTEETEPENNPPETESLTNKPSENNGNMPREVSGETQSSPSVGSSEFSEREVDLGKPQIPLVEEPETAVSYFNPCFARAFFNSLMSHIMGSEPAQVSGGKG